MDNSTDFIVKFWGVRGSLPIASPQTVRFGGNTPCVQLQIGHRLVILDAGSGLYHLGQHLLRGENGIKGDIFITHAHWDHIQGFPFFYPGFEPGNFFTVYGQGKGNLTLVDQMSGQMTFPYFPIKLHEMGAQFDFREISGNNILDLGDGITVKTMENNHPDGGLSYRVYHGQSSCCYITDHEHSSAFDLEMIEFIENSDLVIFDTCFTDEEYLGGERNPSRQGWGHSTWQEAVRLVKAAHARRLILFHHAVIRSDDDLEEIECQARERFANSFAAREGMVIGL